MPPGKKRSPRKLARQVFGLTLLEPGHPEVRRLRRQTGSPSLHGHRVWRASFLLMDYFNQRGLERGTRVLDLGCGWGLVGIYCARHFDARVTALDADAAVFPYLRLHARLNGVPIETRELDFQHLSRDDLTAFDLIVGADICFWDELVDPLHRLVRNSLDAGVAEVLVADPDRPPFDDFCARCTSTCAAEVVDWELRRPVAASGKILRAVGRAARDPAPAHPDPPTRLALPPDADVY